MTAAQEIDKYLFRFGERLRELSDALEETPEVRQDLPSILTAMGDELRALAQTLQQESPPLQEAP